MGGPGLKTIRPCQNLLLRSSFATVLLFGSGLYAEAQTGRANSSSTDIAVGATATGLSDFSFDRSKNEFGVWAASSLGLPSALGASRDTKFSLLMGLRYGRVLMNSSFVAIEYTVDLVPLAVVSQPKFASITPTTVTSKDRDHIYGAGAVPIGFKFIFRPGKRIKPFVAASSGPFYFSKPVPVAEATHFNFFSSGDFGLQIAVSEHRTITIGYKLGHVSNAGVSRVNPGFNSSSVFFGFSIFK
jgi:hypothetical protein